MKFAPYSPVIDGFSQRGAAVRYAEQPPPQELADVVHVFWQLRTLVPLPADFYYHAVPDACMNLLFNQIDTEVTGHSAGTLSQQHHLPEPLIDLPGLGTTGRAKMGEPSWPYPDERQDLAPELPYQCIFVCQSHKPTGGIRRDHYSGCSPVK